MSKGARRVLDQNPPQSRPRGPPARLPSDRRRGQRQPQFTLLLDIEPDIRPRAAITDKGYDAKANRQAARERGICPVIPHRSNAAD
ncbi:MAG: transposase, partial [Stellaceae bacterium]